MTVTSPTLTHLKSYRQVSDITDRVLSYSFVAAALSALNKGYVLAAEKVDSVASVKNAHEKVNSLTNFIDTSFNDVVLTNGVDSALNQFAAEGKLGFWLVLFALDYQFYVANWALSQVVSGASATATSKEKFANAKNFVSNAGVVFKATKEKVPLVAQSEETATKLYTDASKKVEDYKKDASELYAGASKKVESLHGETSSKIKATADTLTSQAAQYIPEQATQAFDHVSSKFEENLKDSSLPRAIVTTGVELGTETLKSLRGSEAVAKAEQLANGTVSRTEKAIAEAQAAVLQ